VFKVCSGGVPSHSHDGGAPEANEAYIEADINSEAMVDKMCLGCFEGTEGGVLLEPEADAAAIYEATALDDPNPYPMNITPCLILTPIQATQDIPCLIELAKRLARSLVDIGAAQVGWEEGCDFIEGGLTGDTVLLETIGLNPLVASNGIHRFPKDVTSDLESQIAMKSRNKKIRNSACDIAQQASLAGLLLHGPNPDSNSDLGSTEPEECGCVVEFCAGTGRLSSLVKQVWPYAHPCKLVLIDKAVFRDSFVMEDEGMGDTTKRITVDIRDLRLSRAPSVASLPSSLSVGATGKHLCGAATDLALRCANGYHVDTKCSIRVAFAVCCHHLCDWKDYVNPDFLKRHGLFKGEFNLMRRLCTKYRSHPNKARVDFLSESIKETGPQAVAPFSSHPLRTRGAWEAALRAEIGIMSKRLLNEGRAAWMREVQGWRRVELLRYVDAAASPENQVLLASR